MNYTANCPRFSFNKHTKERAMGEDNEEMATEIESTVVTGQ
jgi:hypothetical protein